MEFRPATPEGFRSKVSFENELSIASQPGSRPGSPSKLFRSGSRPSSPAQLVRAPSLADFFASPGPVTVFVAPTELPIRSPLDASPTDDATAGHHSRRPYTPGSLRRKLKEPEKPPEPPSVTAEELAAREAERLRREKALKWRQRETSTFVYLPPVASMSNYANNYVRLSMRFVAWVAWTGRGGGNSAESGGGGASAGEPLAWSIEAMPVTSTVELIAQRIVDHHHGIVRHVHLWKDQVNHETQWRRDVWTKMLWQLDVFGGPRDDPPTVTIFYEGAPYTTDDPIINATETYVANSLRLLPPNAQRSPEGIQTMLRAPSVRSLNGPLM